MQKKATGLGRGLDDLLEDNFPGKKTSNKPLVVAKGEVSEPKPITVNSAIYETKTKTLYESKPKTKSLKSNFKK